MALRARHLALCTLEGAKRSRQSSVCCFMEGQLFKSTVLLLLLSVGAFAGSITYTCNGAPVSGPSCPNVITLPIDQLPLFSGTPTTFAFNAGRQSEVGMGAPFGGGVIQEIADFELATDGPLRPGELQVSYIMDADGGGGGGGTFSANIADNLVSLCESRQGPCGASNSDYHGTTTVPFELGTQFAVEITVTVVSGPIPGESDGAVAGNLSITAIDPISGAVLIHEVSSAPEPSTVWYALSGILAVMLLNRNRGYR